jgi:hypothetical protein
VEDQIQFAWGATLTNLSVSGVFDPINRKIKWGPFFDNVPRTLSYQVVPSTGSSGTMTFMGIVSYDGSALSIAGSQQITSGPAPAPSLVPAAALTQNRFTFALSGLINQRYQIESSPDLVNWSAVSIVTNNNGTVLFSDPTAPNIQHRFYRATAIP